VEVSGVSVAIGTLSSSLKSSVEVLYDCTGCVVFVVDGDAIPVLTQGFGEFLKRFQATTAGPAIPIVEMFRRIGEVYIVRARPKSGIKGVALDSEGKEKSMRGKFAPHALNSWSIS
jgi:hypothetical protein